VVVAGLSLRMWAKNSRGFVEALTRTFTENFLAVVVHHPPPKTIEIDTNAARSSLRIPYLSIPTIVRTVERDLSEVFSHASFTSENCLEVVMIVMYTGQSFCIYPTCPPQTSCLNRVHVFATFLGISSYIAVSDANRHLAKVSETK